MIGDSSDAHSHRTRGGVSSEPYALVTSRFDRAQWTLRVEIIGGGRALEGSDGESHWNRPRSNYFEKGY